MKKYCIQFERGDLNPIELYGILKELDNNQTNPAATTLMIKNSRKRLL
jgi:hypothetical protein